MISASGLAPNCGFAKILSTKRPRPASTVEAADRGTVFHGGVEAWVRTGELPTLDDLEIQGWLDLLASQWLPPVDTEVEIAWGLLPDGAYCDVDEPEPHVYVPRAPHVLLTAGRADAAWQSRGCLYVVDWKTGKWPVTPAASNLQVNAAGIALAARIGAAEYRPGVYYVRDGAWDWGDPVILGSHAHAEMFAQVTEAAMLPPEPRPGAWCSRCWERKACPSAPRS